MSRVKEALTRKIGPLQAWVWLAISGVGLFFWRRHQSAGVAGTTATPTDSSLTGSSTDTGQGSGSGFGGGSNGGGDGAGGVPNQPPQTVPPTTPPPDEGPPAPDPSPPPDSGQTDTGGDTTPSGLRVGKLTQPASQSFLMWGGQTFTTQAAFAAWAKAHGSSVAKELANHPEAASIYGNLGKSTAKAPLMFLPRRKKPDELGRVTSAKPPREPSPVSVRTAPPRPGVRKVTEPPVRVTPPRTRSSSPVQAKGRPIIEHRPPAPKPKPPQGRKPLPRGFGYRK